MRVLVACEFSGIVRDAFRARGHDAWSCDLLETESDPAYHLQMDVRDALDSEWDLMIAHPPCTYLTNAGVRHLHDSTCGRAGGKAKVFGAARIEAMQEGAAFFNLLLHSAILHVCVENPLPHCYAKALVGEYTQRVQPWQFGHQETKATCFWLRNLPPLQETDVVGPPPRDMPIEMRRQWNRVHQTSPSADRWRKRSRFYTGIAAAMADQWGALRLH